MPFPDECLRGIPSEKQVLEDDLVSTEVFFFDDDHIRQDGTYVQSVNWHDNGNAIPFTLAQLREDGSLQFRGGIAVISRHDLDRLSKLRVFNQALSYDRDPLVDNPYHGNLILTPNKSKNRRKMMAVTLASHVDRIIPQQLLSQ